MSFLDSIVDFGSDVWDWATGSSTSAGVARAAALGYMLKEVQSSINKDNDKKAKTQGSGFTPDLGVREQVDPNTENRIPVVYGSTFVGPTVFDAWMSNDNQTMWYALAICEQTGVLMSNSQQSVITIDAVYWNQTKVSFQPDGVTASTLTDEDGVSSNQVDGLVQFFAYSGNSNSPIRINNYGTQTLTQAYNIMPNWTANHQVNGTVFVIAKVTYNKEKSVTGLGDLEFKVNNTMRQPGDCIYDYMTNSRYGAGIAPEEINQ